ncbi:MAG: hypothetical protein ACTSR1_00545 [Candidatus Heimdallarchaeota archaeon]
MRDSIKRESWKGKYYWVVRRDNKVIERSPYKSKTPKQKILKHYKNSGTVDINILNRIVSGKNIITNTRELTKAPFSQQVDTYHAFINGKKQIITTPRGMTDEFKGFSRRSDRTKDTGKSSKRNAYRNAKAMLMEQGNMKSYEDKLVLVKVRHSFINITPRK